MFVRTDLYNKILKLKVLPTSVVFGSWTSAVRSLGDSSICAFPSCEVVSAGELWNSTADELRCTGAAYFGWRYISLPKESLGSSSV